jgi:hypothetical protein
MDLAKRVFEADSNQNKKRKVIQKKMSAFLKPLAKGDVAPPKLAEKENNDMETTEE